METRPYSNAYNLFILVLTVVALVVMVLLWLPLSRETLILLRTYDSLICAIFLLDFVVALRRAPSARAYFLHERGWLDLVGAIPTFGIEALGLLRLARISRLRRVSRSLGHQSRSQMVADLVHNRAHYALVTTSLAAFLVMATASVIVLEAEAHSPEGNIRTGADAFWWAIVTLTTVGYGDHFPTTTTGRVAAMFVMVTGIGIIASLASIMGRFLAGPSTVDGPAMERKLDSLATEMAALRQLLDKDNQPSSVSVHGSTQETHGTPANVRQRR
jgi:voltage-gated potassium channel